MLTGAGMSAESGISTFRDSGGLWEQHPVEQVATPEGFRTNPELVLRFYNMRRRELLGTKPNAGHIGLVDLEEHFDVDIITQNVDNLHEQAGSSKVLHLHGELMKSRSTGDESAVFDIDPGNSDINIGDMCPKGYQLRPHIVWFGEAVPMMMQAEAIVRRADIFVIIGTSMNVYPAAGLLHDVKSDVPVYLIDPKDVAVSRDGVNHLMMGASEGVEELKKILI